MFTIYLAFKRNFTTSRLESSTIFILYTLGYGQNTILLKDLLSVRLNQLFIMLWQLQFYIIYKKLRDDVSNKNYP